MAFFDLFSRRSPEQVIKKHAARLRNKRAQAQDRWESIKILRGIGSSAAVEALLLRFTYTTDPSITDQEEKDTACEAIIAIGAPAVDPIREFLRKSDTLSWCLRMLRGLLEPDAVVGVLIELLEGMDTDYERDPQKKNQVLAILEDTVDPRITSAALRFVDDVNETARFNAVGAVLAQADAEEHRGRLLEVLVGEESMRVRARILDGFIDAGWELGEAAAEVRKQLPSGYAIDARGKPRGPSRG